MEQQPETVLPVAEPVAEAAPPVAQPVPYWHAVVLVAVLGGMSLLNVKTGHGRVSHASHIRMYSFTMFYEWLLTAWVWWGVRRSGGSLRELIGGRWKRVEDLLLDIAMGIGGWIAIAIVLACIALALNMGHTTDLNQTQKQIGFLAPSSGLEIVLWLCLSATAGFCEEVMFRGYLQRQCARLVGNRWLALAVVSVFFGLGHGYEGAQRMVLIAVLGFGFGVLSFLRGSLRPAMFAHTAQDAFAGLMLRALR